MDTGLDPHMQRILKDAASYSSQTDRTRAGYPCGPADLGAGNWNFAPASRLISQEPASFSPFDRSSYSQSAEQFRQRLQPATGGSIRLSLPPKKIYPQSENENQVLSNADNHFRFTQNLHEGVPLSQPPVLKSYIIPAEDTLGQLANAMLTKNAPSVPRSLQSVQPERVSNSEMPNIFSSRLNNNLSQLQPQKQQITPPFNLSGYVYSPEGRQSHLSSSSPAGQTSSPSARLSLRRGSTQVTPLVYTRRRTSAQKENDVFVDEDRSLHLTPMHRAQQESEPENYHYTPIPSTETATNGAINQSRHTNACESRHAAPVVYGIQLVSPYVLPDRLRSIFPYELFNAVQSKCFSPVYKSHENVVVSAPTGSGKTAMLELAICKVVEDHQSGTFKIVYLAPIKSLCSERLRDWTRKFSHLNLSCAELTGDTTQGEMKKVRDASIIVTTPEKWDSITRKWSDHAKLVQIVKLVLIDEVHILKDPRGATLEAIVSRMKKMSANVRFVALSATIPNSQDVATWLGKDHTSQHLPAHRELFEETFRPVKLQRHVHGFDGMMNDFAFEKVLDGKLPGLIQKYTHKRPILIFCYTRRSCEQTAKALAEWWSRLKTPHRPWPAPKQKVKVGSKDLGDLLDCGIAFHHAGLESHDRHAVETGFLGGVISVICCTSTLAVGVNLPCHLVVLKGTVGYQDGKLGEYSDLEVMQMLGRAGRPQFDDSAVAIIMTRSDKVERYKRMISGQDTLESTLHLNFIELLNSEISLGTVKNIYEAKVWLNGTFLSVRMRQNPRYYNIDGVDSGGSTDERLEQACERDIKLLQESNLVTNKDHFGCTLYGEAMSRYMVKFETMKLLLSIPPQAKTEEILDTVCQAAEFKDLKMKPNERSVLREFNKSPFIKFPIEETVTTTAHKISLMIQVQLGGIEHPNEKDSNIIKRQFMVDTSMILERMQRLMRCIIDCKSVDEDAIATRHALDLARSLTAGFWEYSNLQLRQIPLVGPAAVRKLVASDVNSIEKLDTKEAADIERILSKNPPFGRKMKEHLAAFPRLEVRSEIVGKSSLKHGAQPTQPKVNVKAILGYRGTKIPVWNQRKPSLTFIAETSSGRLVHFWRGNIMKLDKGFELKFPVELLSVEEQIKCWIACDELVGTIKTSLLKHDVPASQFPSPRVSPLEPATLKFSGAPGIARAVADEFGDDEFSDKDLVAAVQSLENASNAYDSDDFADIDSLAELDAPKQSGNSDIEAEVVEAHRMVNGKFACLHNCRDGLLLKNGKICKHKCCSEGLDKPPCKKRKRTKSDAATDENMLHVGTPSSCSANLWDSNLHLLKVGKAGPSKQGTLKNGKKQKVSSRGPATKFKTERQSNIELADVEVINLLEELLPVPDPLQVPLGYRKLQTLHNSVQKDKNKSIRLPRQSSQFPYESDTRPEFRITQSQSPSKDDFGYGDLSDDDLLSPTQLSSMSENARNLGGDDEASNSQRRKLVSSNFYGNSPDDLDTLPPGLNDAPASHTGTPPFRDSFANSLFDFNAFEDVGADIRDMSISGNQQQEKEPKSSGVCEEDTTRATSLEQGIGEDKHQQTIDNKHMQLSTIDENFPERGISIDTDFMDQFKDYIDFVD